MLLCEMSVMILPQKSKCLVDSIPVYLLAEGHYVKKWIPPGMSVIVAVKTNSYGEKWSLPFPETFELANEVWWISVVLPDEEGA